MQNLGGGEKHIVTVNKCILHATGDQQNNFLREKLSIS